MSNQTIYEEFKKIVGKTSVRSVVYVRTQCKNCNSIELFFAFHTDKIECRLQRKFDKDKKRYTEVRVPPSTTVMFIENILQLLAVS